MPRRRFAGRLGLARETREGDVVLQRPQEQEAELLARRAEDRGAGALPAEGRHVQAQDLAVPGRLPRGRPLELRGRVEEAGPGLGRGLVRPERLLPPGPRPRPMKRDRAASGARSSGTGPTRTGWSGPSRARRASAIRSSSTRRLTPGSSWPSTQAATSSAEASGCTTSDAMTNPLAASTRRTRSGRYGVGPSTSNGPDRRPRTHSPPTATFAERCRAIASSSAPRLSPRPQVPRSGFRRQVLLRALRRLRAPAWLRLSRPAEPVTLKRATCEDER